MEELRAAEDAERGVLLALGPREAQARADVLCAAFWEPVETELYGRCAPVAPGCPEWSD